MRIVKPQVIIEDDLDMIMPNGLTLAQHTAKKIEVWTRRCYKSEGIMTDTSYLNFLKGVFQGKFHTGIADHRMISVSFVTDRAVGEEGVRHRMAAPYLEEDQQVTLAEAGGPLGFLKESTRYCDYTPEGKKAKGMTFILPPWVRWEDYSNGDVVRWLNIKRDQESVYNDARDRGWRPEQARAELPLGIKTEYVMSAPLSSWWNWCVKRSAESAHPQMRQLALPVLRYFQRHFPQFFSNIPMPEGAWNAAHDPTELPETLLFTHKGERYEEAQLIVHPYYDEVPLDVVYED